MIAKLQNPFAAMTLGICLSVALGLALCWRAAGPLLQLAVAARPAAMAATPKAKGWDFWTIEIENISTDLKEERARLHQQADQLDQRAARLAAEEKELARVRASLEALQQEISGRVIEIGADEAKNLRSLSQTYANLTPHAVVAIFREMDDLTAVKILSLMKPDVVGPIFEEMSRGAGADGPLARRAAILSEKLRLMKASRPSSPG